MKTINTMELQKNAKVYTMWWIIFATYLGGPLAGAYLMSRNFEVLHKKNYAQITFRIGIVATLVIFGTLFLIPTSVADKIPNSVIPAVYTVVIFSLMNKYQNEEIKKYLEHGGARQSGWKAAGIGIVSLMILLLCVLVVVMVFPQRFS